MKNLAAHYRPQAFADVTGQDMITTVLSRAAEQDRVATAYLLSGTRGVGKTTIARILAKALNCKNAPTAEPCNVCNSCQMITKGNHVDVTEIDGASNNSVDDARALRENIGYAPMEGRYKVFIIDEAHMLSRSAFNALLKTLEEPPAHVVFILATTEAHKFPITIVSRCQHFIFKRLSEDGLVAHLSRVLTKEEIPYDVQALRIIARRAAGSVRDSMSLLAQTLALSQDKLDMESTRTVLGLAGQELFASLMEAIVNQDCAAVIQLMQKLCDQGVDMGFFLRELAALWRTLFLLREAGENIIPSLNLAEDEVTLWLAMSTKFSTAHLHAAWHMTLDAMRKVIHSPEPAAALELLLLNITLMPRLLPLSALQGQNVSASAGDTSRKAPPLPLENPGNHANSGKPTGRAEREATFAPKHMAKNITLPKSTSSESHGNENKEDLSFCAHNSQENMGHTEHITATNPTEHTAKSTAHTSEQKPVSITNENNFVNSYEAGSPEATQQEYAPLSPNNTEFAPIASEAMALDNSDILTELPLQTGETDNADTASKEHIPLPSFGEILEHIRSKDMFQAYIAMQISGEFTGNTLTLRTASQRAYAKVQVQLQALEHMLSEFCQCQIHIQLEEVQNSHTPQHTLLEEYSKREELQICFQELDAKLYEVRKKPENTKK